MTTFLTNYGKQLGILLVLLISLFFVLNVLKKAPVVGKAAAKAEQLATGQ